MKEETTIDDARREAYKAGYIDGWKRAAKLKQELRRVYGMKSYLEKEAEERQAEQEAEKAFAERTENK